MADFGALYALIVIWVTDEKFMRIVFPSELIR
jgi:hypothetical protein